MESHGHAAAAAAAGSSSPRLCAPISQPSSKSLTYATTLALLGFATPAQNTNLENVVKIEKLSKSCNPGGSGLAFQPVLPASSSQDMIKASGTVICPPTPPSRSPPHLHTPSSRETSGSDSASSSVDEVAKRRKLGGSRAASSAAAVTTSSTTKVAGYGSSTTLLSPTRAVQLRNQTCAGAASGSVPSSPREKAEFASPTTFVQADTSSFRELVQKLTGASDSDLEKKLPITVPSRQASRTSGGGAQLLESSSPAGSHKQQLDNNNSSNTFGGGLLISSKPAIDSLSARRPSFKLHERRQSNIRKLEIKPGLSTATVFKREAAANYAVLSASSAAELVSPSNQKKFSSSSSPSSLAASCSPPPVLTPLSMQDVSEKACHGPRTPTTTYESCCYTGLKPRTQNHLQEGTERERHATPHFFLHPSPSSFDPTRPQPELLSLFPLTSPRATET
jgi:hypothetical protein